MRRERRTASYAAIALIVAAAALAMPGCRARARTPTRYAPEQGPYAVESATYLWTDDARHRDVPVKVYFPKTGAGPFPVIIFSHGLGGTREGYAYLGNGWASHGYVSVHVQHKGSDDAVWRHKLRPMKAMREAAMDPRNAVERPKDVSFAIDRMEGLNREENSPLRGRLDMTRVGVAGHSFGGYTTLAVAGEVFLLPAGGTATFADPRVKAAIAMSAPAPVRQVDLSKMFGGISIPIMHMTGTLDDSPIGDTKAADRRIPYDNINGADQYLVTFIGGDHMVFSGRGRLRGGEKDAMFQRLILKATTEFWDAYLKGDRAAKGFLTSGGLEKAMGENAAIEKKAANETK